jgi:hypothetical protein
MLKEGRLKSIELAIRNITFNKRKVVFLVRWCAPAFCLILSAKTVKSPEYCRRAIVSRTQNSCGDPLATRLPRFCDPAITIPSPAPKRRHFSSRLSAGGNGQANPFACHYTLVLCASPRAAAKWVAVRPRQGRRAPRTGGGRVPGSVAIAGNPGKHRRGNGGRRRRRGRSPPGSTDNGFCAQGWASIVLESPSKPTLPRHPSCHSVSSNRGS